MLLQNPLAENLYHVFFYFQVCIITTPPTPRLALYIPAVDLLNYVYGLARMRNYFCTNRVYTAREDMGQLLYMLYA